MNRTMSVAQLASYLKGVFDDEELLHDVSLSGEVTDISYSDKHTFLTLSEGEFSVRCIHFYSRDRLDKGQKITVRGSVRFYDKRTSISFSYEEFSVLGAGKKDAELKQLKLKLEALGYYKDRKKLPKYVTDVVAVTSPDGAAIRDLIRVVSDKCPFVRIRVFPVKVQGEGAAAQIASAIKKLASVKTDAIVVCRGGGSDEDLDTFNDEELAVAVANSSHPVISAVGHEIDYTLCDFCAGTRAGTPSIAGELINQRAQALISDLYTLIQRAYGVLEDKFRLRQGFVKKLCADLSYAANAHIAVKQREMIALAHRAYYSIDKKHAKAKSDLKGLSDKLLENVERTFIKKRERTEKLCAVLNALDPNRIIAAGYAAVFSDGRSVKRAEKLSVGETVKLIFADGVATATVNSVSHSKGKEI